VSKRPGEARIALDLWRAEHEGAVGLTWRQERRLAPLLAHAQAGSPFYRRLYRGGQVDIRPQYPTCSETPTAP
jgi:hypothetical protein